MRLNFSSLLSCPVIFEVIYIDDNFSASTDPQWSLGRSLHAVFKNCLFT